MEEVHERRTRGRGDIHARRYQSTRETIMKVAIAMEKKSAFYSSYEMPLLF